MTFGPFFTACRRTTLEIRGAEQNERNSLSRLPVRESEPVVPMTALSIEESPQYWTPQE